MYQNQRTDRSSDQFQVGIEDADDKITGYISWKNTEKGRATKFPVIEESRKEILFPEWET